MFLVIVAMVPALLFGTWNIGHQYYLSLGDITTADPWSAMLLDKLIVGAIKVVPLIVVSYATGLGIEFVIAGMNGHAINEGFRQRHAHPAHHAGRRPAVDGRRRHGLCRTHRQGGLWRHGHEHPQRGPHGPRLPLLRLPEADVR